MQVRTKDTVVIPGGYLLKPARGQVWRIFLPSVAGLLLLVLEAFLTPAHAVVSEVRVGVYQNKPKIFIDENGKASGILIDILKKIAAEKNWNLSFIPCKWNSCLDMLQEGKIDIMPDVAYSTKRAQRFDFHQTPALYSWSQVYRRKNVSITSPLDLNNKRIAALSGGIQTEGLETMIHGYGLSVKIVPATSFDEAFRLVRQGKADAAVANHYFGDINASAYKLVETPVVFQPARLFFAVAKGRNQVLLEAIEQYLSAWEKDPDSPYFAIIKRWEGHVQSPLVPHYVWYTLAAVSGLMLIFMLGTVILRREVEQRTRQLRRLSRLYAALSQCNQAIVRCADEADLFSQICRDAVIYGGMKMAWIGMRDDTSGQILPVAAYGDGTGYLEGIKISMDVSDPSGRGPTGTAIRENHPVWCQDFIHDSSTAPWHDKGAKFGWAASASLPLKRGDTVVGSLTLYADEVNAFDQAEQNLLVEMAMDINFALNRFDSEARKKEMEASLLQLSLAVEQSPSSIMITDLDGKLVYVNQNFTGQTGYAMHEVLGKNPRILQSGMTSPETYKDLWDHLKRGEAWRGELINRRKDGEQYVEAALISPVRNASGEVSSYLAIMDDITEKKRAEERIQYLAHFDQLTGLPNRLLLDDHFRFAINLAHRSREHLAVMFLDLDHFKNINDTLGHTVGDQLLLEVAKRVKSVLREEDTVARLGGDEFIFILPRTDEHGAAQVAGKLLEAFSESFQTERHELLTTCSIGIAIYPEDGHDMETLSKNADVAMYRVKQAGRNDFRFFTQEMQKHSARNLQLSNALRHALAFNQLQLHYQPQISLQDGSITGAEALLRWQHPELGMVSPVEFISVAEMSGQIIQIGEWVLNTAAMQMMEWLKKGLPPMVIAVNLSAIQFRHANLPKMVSAILADVGLSPTHLELELTEAVAMDDPQSAIAIIDKLYERGVRLSIDDFGTGYSSLSYLKRFKVHKLKIDQSFVRDITDDPEDKAIVTAIINMAKNLGMHTIAEGVETAGQMDFLRIQGCEEVQGYYFSKPLPSDEFEKFVRQYEYAS
jgi:diguanylate cyclase (GGDEF)-like protein/PAS domain S-box-containing protein